MTTNWSVLFSWFKRMASLGIYLFVLFELIAGYDRTKYCRPIKFVSTSFSFMIVVVGTPEGYISFLLQKRIYIYIRKNSLYINIAQKLKWNAVHYFLSSYIINFMIFLVSYVRYPFDSFCFKLLMDFFVQKSCTIWSYIVCVCPHRTQYLFWFQTILKKINIYFCIGISMGTTVRWNAYTV